MNENEKDIFPPLPAPESEQEERLRNFLRGDGWQEVDVGPFLLDFTKSYEEPKYTLSWHNVPFAPLSGIHAITGQSGNGKTMMLAQMMATIIKGEYGGLKYELSADIPRPRVLYIDTEMEESNTISVKNRVMRMCGRSITEPCEEFVVLMLREVTTETVTEGGKQVKITSAVMRWRMILKAIYQYRPTVVFIDGLLDVVSDFNDNVECQEIIYKCMQLASCYQISLWCVVHQNPGGEKLVGHLGSFIERKVSDVIMTKKEKNAETGAVTFTVKQTKARGRDFQDWQFRVVQQDGCGIPEQIEPELKVAQKGSNPDDVHRWLVEGRNDVKWPATLNEIKGILKKYGGIGFNDILQIDITTAKNRRFIVPQPDAERKKGQRCPKYYLNDDEEDIVKPDADLFTPPTEDAPPF